MPFALSSGFKIYYEVEGAGPPLVLLHGSGMDGASWRHFGYVSRLKASYQVILIDARGHGRSDKPHDPVRYSLRNRAEDVVAVLDALKIGKSAAFGYSMGGWTSLGLIKYAPGRFSAIVAGATHPYARSFEFARRAYLAGLDRWVAGLDKAFRDRTPAVRKSLLANDVAALIASHGDRPAIEGLEKLVSMPCLLLIGAADPVFPETLRFHQETSETTLISLPGRDHLGAFLDDETATSHIKDFLAAALT